MIVVIDLEVVSLHAPPLLSGDAAQAQAPSFAAPQANQPPTFAAMPGHAGPQVSSASSAYGAYGGGTQQQKPVMRNDGAAGQTIPIKALNPYSNKWSIKARITSKGEKRTWNNAKGSVSD